ncbi:hypothetical protein Nepgr_004228 [Nepenthes gracilis]|uniref:DYW domain-containing protein n=1 Tax=Nepenthes gracilis TaxID=150966 RepID=A0AAD3S106_NEPGR|nr:hypothetical protein Nepgr_004228 [Nepenthes gracilis]
MATSIQHNFYSSLTVPSHFISKSNPSLNLALKTTNFEQNPVWVPSLKQICKQGNLREAFNSFSNLFTDQNSSLLCPDEAYSSVLELCASKKAPAQGQQVHAHLIKSNAQHDSVFLSTKLVFMYGKCGLLWDAQKLFDNMPQRTIFSWNAMIGTYVSNGRPFEALELYYVMRISGESLDAFTFPCVLKACGMLNDPRQGAVIHGCIVKSGYDSNDFVSNAIVSMYAKCDDIIGARQLFDEITDRQDVVLWNSIISGYSESGQPLEALTLFRELQRSHVDMNTYTFVAALQACEEPSFRRLGMEIHAATLKFNNHLDLYVANAMVDMYARCGRMKEAEKIFNQMIKRDSISWNSMLTGLIQNGLFTEAVEFFREMQAKRQKPDKVSLISILSVAGRLENLLIGMEAHAYAMKIGSDIDLKIGNTLIDLYAKCHYMNYMDIVFRKMTDKDPISWTTVIAGYAQSKYYTKALEVFREVQAAGTAVDAMMIGSILLACTGLKWINHTKEIHGYIMKTGLSDLVISNTLVDTYGECGNIEYANRVFNFIEDKDIVSWTSMILSYVKNGLANEALCLHGLMQEYEVEPDSVAVVSLLTATASLSALKKGKEIHGFILRMGFLLEGSIPSSLVDMYACCGAVENSYKMFNCVEDKDVVLWTSMINASGMHGHGTRAIELFSKMEAENVYPDHVTFLSLLHACSHSNLPDEGQQFLEIMRFKYHLEPWPEHYACLVDLLARANRLQEAYRFLRNMPVETTAAWCALLGACHVHGEKPLGEIAAQKLLNLEPQNPGNYVLVSNVFAATGRWDDVEVVRKRMRQARLKKNPACSWIEVRNKVHTFISRDRSHPQSDEIYQKLAEIIGILEKEGGYVPQTKYVLHNVEEEDKAKMLYGHSERLAIAYGLFETSKGTIIRVAKNLRVCGDCHTFLKLVSRFLTEKLLSGMPADFTIFLKEPALVGISGKLV